MTLTDTERNLLAALLAHFRISLMRQLTAPGNQLTDEGKARYRADVALAETIEAKLDEKAVA